MVGMHPCHALVGWICGAKSVGNFNFSYLGGYVLARLRSYYVARLVLHSYTAKKKQYLLDIHGCHDTLASYVARSTAVEKLLHS